MILADLVAESADRWRYLELALALTDGSAPADPQELAALLLPGLARPRTPVDTLEALIVEEEFTAAERLHEHLFDLPAAGLAAGDDQRLAAVPDRLASARDAVQLRVKTQWQTMNERVQRVGLP